MSKNKFIILVVVLSVFELGRISGRISERHQCARQADSQPAPEPPFCQYLSSPVGGRLAQLPEGYGPHD